MAAGPLNVINAALVRFGGQLDLSAPDLWAVLCDNSQALDETFVGASGQGLYSDLTGEVSGAGYTAGGEQLSGVTWSGSRLRSWTRIRSPGRRPPSPRSIS